MVFSNGAGHPHTRNSEYRDLTLNPLAKVYSKWIMDLNVKFKTISLLEDNMEENLDDLMWNQRHSLWRNIVRWTSLKLKIFAPWLCEENETSHRLGENIWKRYIWWRLLSKVYKELLKCNDRKMCNLIKKWAKDPNRHLYRRYMFGKWIYEKMFNIICY